MTPAQMQQATHGELDARWRELLHASDKSKPTNAEGPDPIGREMSDIVHELERRRVARDMELKR